MKRVVCYGEILWDMLPTGKKLGGAPLNVALRIQSLGHKSAVISSIGKDSSGDEIVTAMKSHNADLSHLQVSQNFDTSEVLVHLDNKGSASYDIKMPCAWDDITLLEEDVNAVKAADAFIYGSLVARSDVSQDTLYQLVKGGKYNVFDVNLRPPHYTYDRLEKLMQKAHFIKFNDDEILEICSHMGKESSSVEECIQFIAQRTNTTDICVTLGEKGAVLYQDNTFVYNKGYKITVADTVGAGDSFLATIISKLLDGTPPQEAIDYASAVGAVVASMHGANPMVTTQQIEEMMRQ